MRPMVDRQPACKNSKISCPSLNAGNSGTDKLSKACIMWSYMNFPPPFTSKAALRLC